MRKFLSAEFWLPILTLFFVDLSGPDPASKDEFSTAVETRSIIMAFRQSSLTFVALWQCVMVFTAFGALGRDGLALSVVVILVGLGALLARTNRRLDPFISTGMAGTGLWAYLASADMSSALVFSGSWQINFASSLGIVLVLRPYGVPLAAGVSVVLAAILAFAIPEWGAEIIVSILATQISIIIAVRLGVSRLVFIAAEADAITSRRNAALQRSRLIERVSMELAEESRMLHDTAINTLGAIADGGAGAAGHQQIQEQCRHDVELLHALRSRTGRPGPDRLEEVFSHPGFSIRRSGADDDEIASYSQFVSAPTATAIVRVIREAVNNVEKHSGADHAVIDVRTSEGRLTITVSDPGRGFDPRILTDGRGITDSIIGRARDNGFHASIDSQPGAGTRVTVTVPLLPDGIGSGHPEAAEGANSASWTSTVHLYQRSSELWAIGVTAVSIVLTAAGGTNNHMALFPMIALMATACLVYRYAPGFQRHRLASAFLAAISIAVFVLSATAVGFGSDGAIHWQALAPTGPFVLLLAVTPRLLTRGIAVALWALTALVIALVGLSYSATAAQIALVAGTVGIGFTGLWATLQRLLESLGRETLRSEREAHEALLQAELEEAAQKSNQRWMDAGLDSAISLLDEIGRNDRELASESTRQACGIEERYLRQLVQISPNLVNLSLSFPATLARARDLGVSYFLRLGDVDIRDEGTAQSISSYILRTLTEVSPGDELRVSLFPVDGALHLTLVGESITPPDFPFAKADHARLGALDVVEVTFS